MKIACDNCGGTIAHAFGNSTIELVRQGHKVTTIGKDYTVFASCPNTGKCMNKVALVVENGQLIKDNLTEKGDQDEEEKGDDGGSEGGSEEGEGEGEGQEGEGDSGGDQPPGGEGSGEGNGDDSEAGGEPEKQEDAGQPPESRKYTRV